MYSDDQEMAASDPGTTYCHRRVDALRLCWTVGASCAETGERFEYDAFLAASKVTWRSHLAGVRLTEGDAPLPVCPPTAPGGSGAHRLPKPVNGAGPLGDGAPLPAGRYEL